MAAEHGTIQVEGVEYLWSVRHQPRWTERRLVGLSIAVSLSRSTKELLLEFRPDYSRHRNMPQHQRARITEQRLEKCIRGAIQSGWEPDSRGKPFVFDAGPMNSN